MARSVTLQVTVNLDPVPGPMHDPLSAEAIVGHILKNQIGHYNPVVVLQETTLKTDIEQTLDKIVELFDAGKNESQISDALGILESDVHFVLRTRRFK